MSEAAERAGFVDRGKAAQSSAANSVSTEKHAPSDEGSGETQAEQVQARDPQVISSRNPYLEREIDYVGQRDRDDDARRFGNLPPDEHAAEQERRADADRNQGDEGFASREVHRSDLSDDGKDRARREDP